MSYSYSEKMRFPSVSFCPIFSTQFEFENFDRLDLEGLYNHSFREMNFILGAMHKNGRYNITHNIIEWLSLFQKAVSF